MSKRRKKVAVSACLLGCPCRYDGKSMTSPKILELLKDCTLVPVCPEVMGGLATPRAPIEIVKGRAVNKNNEDVTAAFDQGSQIALDLVLEEGCDAAVLMQRSPSCGCGKIYDGTFDGHLIEGDGWFTRLLKEKGIPTIASDTFNEEGLSSLKDDHLN